MPANANIVIADGATTPVNHTFVPAGLDGSVGLARFVERSDGVFVGEPKLDIIIRPVTKGQPTRKATVLLTAPKRVVDVDGNVTVSYEDLGKSEFTVSASSTTISRKNLRVMMANALLSSSVAQAIDNMETYW
mgnify:CR=1 FL=1